VAAKRDNSKLREETMNDVNAQSTQAIEKQQATMWANGGNGEWYAIPAALVDSVRAAGIDVQKLPPQKVKV
jgi:hypothetical protein